MRYATDLSGNASSEISQLDVKFIHSVLVKYPPVILLAPFVISSNNFCTKKAH